MRVQGIAAKSRTFVDEYLLHPTLLDIADRVLLPYCGDYWLSQSETIYIGPGNERQALHRDDLNWNLAAQLRVPLQISVLVALGDYDAEVGATHVIPRSHRWPLDRPFDASMSQQVELAPGRRARVPRQPLHGGGANVTDRPLAQGAVPLVPRRLAHARGGRAARCGRRRRRDACRRVRASCSASPGSPERATDDPAEAALALWQLDADDPQVVDGTFRNR